MREKKKSSKTSNNFSVITRTILPWNRNRPFPEPEPLTLRGLFPDPEDDRLPVFLRMGELYKKDCKIKAIGGLFRISFKKFIPILNPPVGKAASLNDNFPCSHRISKRIMVLEFDAQMSGDIGQVVPAF